MTNIKLIKVKAIELLEEPYLCDEVRETVNKFLDTESSDLSKLVVELQDGVLTLDEGIEFVESGMATKLWGDAEAADNYLKECKTLKASGEVYCGCGACQKTLELIGIINNG